MNKQIQKIVNTATAEIGYKESGTNITKYSQDIDTRYPDFYNTKKQGVAWCDIFVDWCFLTSFGEEKALYMLCQPKKSAGAGCKFSADYYKKNKRFYTTPEVGDQIFFISNGDIKHTGIVTNVADKKIYTVEGNSDNCVKAHSYALGSKKIAGYGRPRYDEETDNNPVAPVQSSDRYYVVVKGDTLSAIAKKYGTTVKILSGLNKIANPDLIYPGEKILLPDNANSAQPAPESDIWTGTVNTISDPLNIRAGAGTNFGVLGQLPKGSSVRIKGAAVNGWYKLADRNGYVSAKLIKR